MDSFFTLPLNQERERTRPFDLFAPADKARSRDLGVALPET
ncbi:MAG: hypothetical protein ACI4P3_03095 [Candidatus Spyradosoma sp.]